jgi:sec-independent protein translocase protein TatC
MITATEYFGFATSMALAFGLCFELPIVILALAALGIVTPRFLNKYRRHAIVICVIIGAFLTPGDLVWTTIAMAVPLYLLYELSVVLTYGVHRRRMRRQAERDANTAEVEGAERRGATA